MERVEKFAFFALPVGPFQRYGFANLNHLAAGCAPLIPLSELVNATLASFAAMTAARENRAVILAEEYAEILGSTV